MNKAKTVEEHMESLRPHMTGDRVDLAYVLGVVEFYAHDTGDPEIRLKNIQNTITAFDRLLAERRRQIVEADLDEIRDSFFREGR